MEYDAYATIDELREINLGTTDELKPIFVSKKWYNMSNSFGSTKMYSLVDIQTC